MSIIVRCTNPACGHRFDVPEDFIGRTGRCSQCKTKFVMQPAGAIQPAAPAAAASGKAAGQGAIGRFQLRARLGAGAFGTVYRAYDPQLEREVALKVPQAGVLESSQRVERFLREAKAAAGLHHPNIVPVYDAGSADSAYYIASAFIEGKALAAAIREDRGMGLRRAAQIVHDLAEALAYAHDQGIVHRDVKPANVMLDGDDRPHLMDFGLAARLESTEKLTHEGAVLGTPSYMAPEQARGQQGDAKPESDQYSLGVVLYELITGRTPFEGPPQVILFNVLNKEPPAPRTLRKDVPRDLETICLKAMAKRPEDRYANCHALAADLQRWMEGEPIRARRLGLGERFIRWCKKEPKLAAAGAVTLASLALAVGVLLWRVGNLLADVLSERQAKEQVVEERDQTQAQLKLAEEGRAVDRRNDYVRIVHLAQAQLEEQGPAGSLKHLQLCVPEHRGWEWRHLLLLAERAPEAVRLLEGKTGSIAAFAWTPDGQRLVVLHDNGVLVVWDAWNATVIRTVPLRTEHRWGMQMVLSADGARAAIAVPSEMPERREDPGAKDRDKAPPPPPEPKLGGITVWDTTSGEAIVTLKVPLPPQSRTFLALGPDGKRLAVALAENWQAPANFKVYDAESGAELIAWAEEFEGLRSIAFSPDGGRLLTITGGAKFTTKEEEKEVDVEGPDGKSERKMVKVSTPVQEKLPSRGRLWDAQTAKEVLSLEDVPEGVQQLTFSPDGRRLAAPDAGAQFVVKKVAEAVARMVPVTVVKKLPDGKEVHVTEWKEEMMTMEKEVMEQIGGGSGVAINVWDAQTGKKSLHLTGLVAPASCVAFSPDGKRIAAYGAGNCSAKGHLTLWDGQNGQRLAVFAAATNAPLMALAFSPDGVHIAGAGLHSWPLVVVWSTRTGRILQNYDGQSGPVSCLAWSPDGDLVSSSSACTGRAKVWEVKSGREVLSVEGVGASYGGYAAPMPASYGALPPRGDLVAWGYGRGPGPGIGGGCVGNIAFTRDGKQFFQGAGGGMGCYGAYGGLGGSVRIWDRAPVKEVKPPKEGERVVAIRPDGGRIVVVSGGTRTAHRQIVRTMQKQGPDGKLEHVQVCEYAPISIQAPLVVQVRRTTTGEVVCALEGVGEPITTVVFSPDGRRLATGSNGWDMKTGESTGQVQLWDAESGRLLATHKDAASVIAFSGDGKRLASANLVPPPRQLPVPIGPSERKAQRPVRPGLVGLVSLLQAPVPAPREGKPPPDAPVRPPEVKIFDAETGKEVITLKDFKGPVWQVGFGLDGERLLTWALELQVWDVKTGKAILTHPDTESAWALSPDGSRLVVAFGGRVSHEGAPPPLAPSDAGVKNHPREAATDLVALGGDDVARFPPVAGEAPPYRAQLRSFDLRTGAPLKTLDGGPGRISCITFSPDGALLASAGGQLEQPGEVRVWEAQTGKLLLNFRAHQGPVEVVAFSPDGGRLASGGQDGIVKVWTIALPSR
jgi:WD40 repeat protein